MKTFNVITLLFLSVVASFGGGAMLAKTIAERSSADLLEGLIENQLGNNLITLRYIERGEISEAQKLLQAETSGQLSWIMMTMEAIKDAERIEQRCKVLNTLKEYRAKHRLFAGQEWDYLWKIPGMKEEEAKRTAFLARLNCGGRFF